MKKSRTTCQRMKILEYLKSVHTHPNADTVYKAVKKQLPAITLATVYRNLNLLADQGIIQKMTVNGEFKFDADIKAHQHFICNKCNKIYDFFKDNVSKTALKNVDPKFKVEEVRIVYKGLCPGCK
ncbi:transcriptional repressor [Candidatus Woesearchaeota archaeon]|nr:transcriptional repressor [Candidatus Woesearchaeota archaeon]